MEDYRSGRSEACGGSGCLFGLRDMPRDMPAILSSVWRYFKLSEVVCQRPGTLAGNKCWNANGTRYKMFIELWWEKGACEGFVAWLRME